MKIIDLQESKIKINELIDVLTLEVITDLFQEIKTYAESGNIRDIELTVENIRDVEKKSFEIKQKILKSESLHRIFKILDCGVFYDIDQLILSKILNEEVIIKK